MTLTTYKWSIEEWHDLVASGVLAGKKVELFEGEIIEMSPEGVPHSYTQQSVSDYLRELLQDKAYVRDAHPITLDNSEPEPDIAIVRLPNTIYAQHHPYPEDIYWLVEISNQSLAKDLEQKRCDPAVLKDTASHNVSSAKQRQFDLPHVRAPRRTITYARNGISEYWVIDLKNSKLIVHTQPQNNSYVQMSEYQTGIISPLAFPQIAIAPNQL